MRDVPQVNPPSYFLWVVKTVALQEVNLTLHLSGSNAQPNKEIHIS